MWRTSLRELDQIIFTTHSSEVLHYGDKLLNEGINWTHFRKLTAPILWQILANKYSLSRKRLGAFKKFDYILRLNKWNHFVSQTSYFEIRNERLDPTRGRKRLQDDKVRNYILIFFDVVNFTGRTTSWPDTEEEGSNYRMIRLGTELYSHFRGCSLFHGSHSR